MVHRGELIPAYLDGELVGEEKQWLEENTLESKTSAMKSLRY